MAELHVEAWDLPADLTQIGITEILDIVMPEISYNRATLEQLINILKHHLQVMHGGGILNKDGGELKVTTTGTAGEYKVAPGGIVVERELIVYNDSTTVVPANGDYIYVTDEYMIDYGSTVPSNAEVLAKVNGSSITDLRTQLANGDEVVGARGEYPTLDERLDNVATLAESLDTDLSSIATRVGSAESDITALQNTVSSIKTEVENARNTFSNLDSRLDDIESRISALETA